MRRLLVTALCCLLAACATNPLTIQAEAGALPNAPMKNVVIADESDGIDPLVAESFYTPIVDSLRNRLSDLGIQSAVAAVDQKSLNPNANLAQEIRRSKARHIIYVQPTKIRYVDPEASFAVRSRVQRNFVGEYILTFTIADLAIGKNVWKGTIQTPKNHLFHKDELPAMMALLETELQKANLISSPGK